MSTDAQHRRKHRPTTLAVSAEDNFTEPMLADDSDDDDEREDDTTSININETTNDRISFYTNT